MRKRKTRKKAKNSMKRTRKGSVKIKIQRAKSIKKTPLQIKQDLELFAKGVERLKGLGSELNSLDTRGFYKEEQEIKTRLKNVSDIPLIENQIKNLRAKINYKYKPKQKRKSYYKSMAREIEKLREEVKRKKPALYGVKREIKEIAEKIGKKKPEFCAGFRSELKEIKEKMPRIEGGIKEIKGIKETVPKIEEKVKELSRKFRGGHVNVDSGVGVLVDAKFNNFLNEVKSALSERVKEREKEADDILKGDLQEREDEFRGRYEELVREFNDGKRKIEEEFNKKYKKKLKTE